MPLLLILFAIILIVSAIKNTQGELATALEQDIPGYLIWAAAIIGIGAIGWIPGLKPVSRWLLALVIVVIVLTNYQQIIDGFKQIGQGVQPAAAVPTQAAAYTQAVSAPQQAQASSPMQTAVSATGAVTSAISGFGSVASDIPSFSDIPIVGDLLGGIF